MFVGVVGDVGVDDGDAEGCARFARCQCPCRRW